MKRLVAVLMAVGIALLCSVAQAETTSGADWNGYINDNWANALYAHDHQYADSDTVYNDGNLQSQINKLKEHNEWGLGLDIVVWEHGDAYGNLDNVSCLKNVKVETRVDLNGQPTYKGYLVGTIKLWNK